MTATLDRTDPPPRPTRPTRTTRFPPRTVKGLVALALAVGLGVAMVTNTTFLRPAEVVGLNPVEFDAAVYVEEEFPGIVESITAAATDLAVLAPALAADPVAAGAEYGTDLGSGKFAYPVRATGTVAEVDEAFLVLAVPGVPPAVTVRIPLAAAVSGTPVRDATGEITFGDFADQTDFQSVANELKLRIRSEVIGAIDPAALRGQEITVVGAYATGGPPDALLVQPVSIEVP